MSPDITQEKATKSNIISSLLWKFLERGGTQGIQFVIQIILARLLSPNDYGTLAILLAFIAIANVFVQSGFSTALIQKQEADNLDFSSVFYFSLFVAALCYIIIFYAAPLIAKFYENEELTYVLRVLAIILFFGALNSVQNTVVAKRMQFRRLFFSSMGGAFASGVIGLVLAYNGFGLWTLVAQQIANNAFICIILWFTVKWRPDFKFSFGRLKKLFGFGWKLLCSSIVYTGSVQLYSLVIGKHFSSTDLGFFNRGETFPSIITNNVDGAVQSVMLPAMSSHNEKVEEVKAITKRTITAGTYLLMPLMFGIAAVSKNMVLLLLTDKWLDCVLYVQLACFCFALYPIHTTNLTAMNSMGRSDLYFYLEVIKSAFSIFVLVITIPLGLKWIAIGRVFSGIIGTFINSYPNKKLLNYGCIEQWKDVLPAILLSAFMGSCVYLIGKLISSPILGLTIQVLSGAVIYISLSVILKNKSFIYISNILKGYLK